MKKLELKENLEKYTGIETCPVRNIISRFSGKWAILILCVLSENDMTRFKEISRAIPDISPKVLSETLRNLEEGHLISRHLYAEVPPRTDYSLTALGKSLMPHIFGLIKWAVDNYQNQAIPPEHSPG
ncbi:MAG: helix-turn-helix transcriptional regulator [Muribaculaceae bacterium]|nr:helix-turn-helix transcriptional regulator [Muribaculaceae bacterium]MDE6753970.1 helix-turn-helix transcriptional regulator [Muribaculaceae bacterium]